MKKYFNLLAMIILGFIIGILVAHFSKISALNDGEGFLYGLFKMIFIFSLAYLINVIIHEAGHLIFGLISGYAFLSFRVFNILLVKMNGKFKIKRYAIAGTGGQCIMIPPSAKNFPYILYNLGGIISGLVFSIICFLASFYLEGSIYILLMAMAAIGIIFSVLNGIPFKSTVQNDAQNIIDLNKSEDNRASFYIMLKVEEALANGRRLKDLPREYFSLDIPYENSVYGMANEILKYSLLFVNEDFEKAEKRNDELRAVSSLPLYKNLLLMDKIYMMLLRNESPKEVKKLISDELIKIMNMMRYESAVLRTQYVIEQYVNEDDKKAKKVLEHFKKLEKHCHKMGEYEQEKEFIDLIDSKKG